MTETPPPPKGESGYQNPGKEDFYAWGIEGEPFELQWPDRNRAFDRMRRTDSQVFAVLRAISLPVRATTWRLDPAGASTEVTEFISQQMDLPIIGAEGRPAIGRRDHRFSWSDHLRMALLMLPYGSMFFEQVVEVTADGHWGLRKLAARMPSTLSKINVARDGGLVSIEQKAPTDTDGNREKIVIPVDRLVAYVHEREGADWAGNSILRPMYKNWAFKDPLLRIEAQAAERNSMGIATYTSPPNATADQIESGRQLAEAYRAGSRAGLSLPYEGKFELKGVSGQLYDIRKPIEYHDAQIARAALAHFLNLDGQGGSYALASTQESLFTTSLGSVADTIADVATQHIVADLVDWNFGPDEPIPRVVYDDLRTDSLAVATALRTLADAGLIRGDRSLEEWLRRDMGAPAKDTPPPEGYVPAGQAAPDTTKEDTENAD